MLFAGTSSAQISKKVIKTFFADAAIQPAHVGISIYDPAADKYIFTHQSDKYFIPASNTKLFTLYAGFKYLEDSIIGLRYLQMPDALILFPTGDPSFLGEEFPDQPVYHFLKDKKNMALVSAGFNEPLGNGWAWNDYEEYYMAQRSEFPIYGNMVTVAKRGDTLQVSPPTYPIRFENNFSDMLLGTFRIHRQWGNDTINISLKSDRRNVTQRESITMQTSRKRVAALLSDTLHQPVQPIEIVAQKEVKNNEPILEKIYSIPADSVYKPMMHRSDNFFAEQVLLMSSNELLGYMKDEDIIDTLLKTHLAGLPQPPRWVDGSGLSRYNLFSPDDFIFLLNKMKSEIEWDRLTHILPSGGEGTLRNYYQPLAGKLFAKTGTLSNNCALSGYMITKKKKLLIFSVLVNNYPGSATPVRRAVERFLMHVWQTQ